MKKISTFLFVAVLIVTFAACNSEKKTDAPAKTEVAEESAVPEPEPVAPVDTVAALKAFQAFVKEYAEAYNNIAKDPRKFTTLSGQLQERVNEMESIKEGFNKKQLEDYQKAFDLIVKVSKRGK